MRSPRNGTRQKLFIHIGLGKTGTTSLQNFFWRNREVLAKHGVIYPELGNVASAHHLLSPHRPIFLKGWKFLDAADWMPALAHTADRPVLISSELISSLDAAAVAPFAEALAPYFDAQIIVYVRRIDNLIMADYNQQIKAGLQKFRLEDVVANIFSRMRFDTRLQPWLSAFGQENVHVRAYERGQFRNKDICEDFIWQTFGIDRFEDFKADDENPNARFSFAALEYKRIINNIIPDTRVSTTFNAPLLDYSAGTDKHSTAVFHESNLLPNSVRSFLLRQHADTASWIARDLMNRPDGRLFYDPEPDPHEAWVEPSYTQAEFSAISDFLHERGMDKTLRAQIMNARDQGEVGRYAFAFKLLPHLKD